MDRITLSVSGDRRDYLFRFTPRAGSPLVLVLHGAGGTAAWADYETGWSELAAREGFALALPEGVPPHRDQFPKFLTNPPRWNDGSGGPTDDPATADDVAFLATVLTDAVRRSRADPRRVYLSGFSNGAGMTFRAAAELSDRIAAIAPVAGYCRIPAPRPARPVPTLYLIGSEDPLVPLRGGEVRSPWRHRLVRREPVAATLERWATALGCDPVPVIESDTGGMRTEVFPGPVEFRAMFVEGLGHHWPGGKGRLNPKIAGSPSDRLNATAEVWRFFQRHAMA